MDNLVLNYMAAVYVFLFGACIGSFLNVCIYRIPAGESIVSPPSSCPRCGHRIRLYDNIPILGWLLLRGRCRDCSARISIRYPIVELATALLALLTFYKFGLAVPALLTFAFGASLLVISLIDLDHYIIPNTITLPGIPACMLASLVMPEMTWKASLAGILAGGGSLYAVA